MSTLVKLPTGICEIFYELWLKRTIESYKKQLSNDTSEYEQFIGIYIPSLIIVNLIIRGIGFIITQIDKLIFQSELGMLCLSLVISILFIEMIRSDVGVSLKNVYATGNVSMVRKIADEELEDVKGKTSSFTSSISASSPSHSPSPSSASSPSHSPSASSPSPSHSSASSPTRLN